MTTFLIFAFLAIMAVDAWAAIAVGLRCGGGKRLSFSYFAIALLAGIGTFLMTSLYSYYSNSNTRIFGWPIPRVILQRNDTESPWLDYIGPTILFAYPMNFVLYMFIPSVAFILILWLRKHRLAKGSR